MRQDGAGAWAQAGRGEPVADLLVFLPFPIQPVTRGNRARARWLCDDLKALGIRLHGLLHMREDGGRVPEAMLRAHARYFDTFHMVPCTLGPAAGRAWDPALSAYLPHLFAGQAFDAVLVFGAGFAPVLAAVPPGTLRLLDPLGEPAEPQPGLDRADLLLALTPEEAGRLSALAGAPALSVGIRPPPGVRIARRPRAGLLRCSWLAGQSPGTQRAVRSLAEEIAARPGLKGRAEITVFGRAAEFLDAPLLARAQPVLRADPVGDDLAAIYGATDAILIPAEGRSGFRIATLEALGTGLPVLSTRDGTEGIGAGHPAHACASVGALLDWVQRLAEGREDIEALARAGQTVLAEYRAGHAAALGSLAGALGRPRLVLDPGEGTLTDRVWLLAAASAFAPHFDLALLGPAEELSRPLGHALALLAGRLAAVAAPEATDAVWTRRRGPAGAGAVAICPVPKSPDGLRHVARLASGGRRPRFVVRSAEQARVLETVLEGAAVSLAHPVGRIAPEHAEAERDRVLVLLDGQPVPAADAWLRRFATAMATRGLRLPLTAVHETPGALAERAGLRATGPAGAAYEACAGRHMLVDAGQPGSEEWDLRAWLYSVAAPTLAVDSRLKAGFAAQVAAAPGRAALFGLPEEAAAHLVRFRLGQDRGEEGRGTGSSGAGTAEAGPLALLAAEVRRTLLGPGLLPAGRSAA